MASVGAGPVTGRRSGSGVSDGVVLLPAAARLARGYRRPVGQGALIHSKPVSRLTIAAARQSAAIWFARSQRRSDETLLRGLARGWLVLGSCVPRAEPMMIP